MSTEITTTRSLSQSAAFAQPLLLDPRHDPIQLTCDFVNIPSVSHNERDIADAVERGLRTIVQPAHPHVTVERYGHCLIAQTHRGLAQRAILAGHLDTVPVADNLPVHREVNDKGEECLYGCGTVDMKSGDAVFYALFHALASSPELAYDLTLIFYDAEEVEAIYNGLGHLSQLRPDLLKADIAILGEPTGAVVEAGCQGTLRMKITARGVRAHSARAWMGSNAIHHLAPLLTRLESYTPRTVSIDGCEYKEGLNAVSLAGGVAGNVIPDEATLEVNYRFAPDRSLDEAVGEVCRLLHLDDDDRYSWTLPDLCPGALPGLSSPAAAPLVAVAEGRVRAKYGWTDVSRFSALGIPAVNMGPGDPSLSHKRDEHCPTWQITEVYRMMELFLCGKGTA